MTFRILRHAPPRLTFWLPALAACSAAGDSDGPIFPVIVEVPTEQQPNPNAATNGSTSLPPLVSPPDPEPEGPSDAACVTSRAEVEIIRQPVDIIIALDNSGSMEDEARAVEANINVSFAAILEESAVDYRMILISEHRTLSLQDTAVCIRSPLSTIAACPSDEPGLTERFFQYSTEIGSSDSFDVLLETYDGSREDEFELAPLGWSTWLRPGAQKVFLEISDDDENTSVAEFLGALTAIAPEHFGPEPSQPSFVWHSIVGLAERSVPTEPHAPADPIVSDECAGDVASAGTTYQELSRATGGLRFPICEFGGYDAVFRRIAADVVQASASACDFALPSPPAGRELELDTVAVSYQREADGQARVLGQVASADACAADAFVVDASGVHLCAEACAEVSAEARTKVEVLFTCESTVLR